MGKPMKNIGMWMVILGAGSFVLHMLDREFILLMWVDMWGPTVGNGIRIVAIILGAGLFFMAGRRVPSERESE